jgi:L-arabinokinase
MREKKKSLAYYVTDHGLGHAVRSLEVIRHLLEQEPDLEIILVSTLPEFIIRNNVQGALVQGALVQGALSIRKKHLDIGLVQQDSLQFDLPATRKALESLYYHREALLEEEIDFFKTNKVQCIVCDIPFLPFAAASRCGIPAIGISNFTWDWIYQAYASSDPRWLPLVGWIRESHQGCSLFLQLPMHGDCSACPAIRSVPLVARQSERRREQTRQILGLRSGQKAYLVSFAALEFSGAAQNRLQDMTDAIFLYKRPLKFHLKNGICIDRFDISYADVVAAADGVITKPGYGIVADCLVHGTPIIYTDRGVFPEYSILVQEMERHLATVYLPSQDLYAGRWESAIRKLEDQPRRIPTLASNGGQVCAQTILRFL